MITRQAKDLKTEDVRKVTQHIISLASRNLHVKNTLWSNRRSKVLK